MCEKRQLKKDLREAVEFVQLIKNTSCFLQHTFLTHVWQVYKNTRLKKKARIGKKSVYVF